MGLRLRGTERSWKALRDENTADFSLSQDLLMVRKEKRKKKNTNLVLLMFVLIKFSALTIQNGHRHIVRVLLCSNISDSECVF